MRGIGVLATVLWKPCGLGVAHAVYQPRFSIFATGAITFTGSTPGLAKATNENRPGAMGTFNTTDLSSQDGPDWLPGTTSDWRLSRYSAGLRLPAGAQVLRAELVWSGTWAETVGHESVRDFLEEPITFVTPLETRGAADPASAQRSARPAAFAARAAAHPRIDTVSRG